MYEYVTKAQVTPYLKQCRTVLTKLLSVLDRDYGINAQVELVGSGANNMVLRYGKEPFDLDFNLVVNTLPQELSKNPEKLKRDVRLELDRLLVPLRYSHGKDSTSSIKYIIYSQDKTKVNFSFDLAIIQRVGPDGIASRLIHDKHLDRYTWSQIRSSDRLKMKVHFIKQAGPEKWQEVRRLYLEKKESYRNRSDGDHPSYVVFIEGVNQVYQSLDGGNNMSKVSGKSHTQSQMNHHANQSNPNNAAHRSAQNNHANQCNPNNRAYHSSRNSGNTK